MRDWRLIVSPDAADGAWNMAVDAALLAGHADGDAPPTLRLYTWKRPTVSLGRFQHVEDVDLDYCRAHGIDVCRRPTGGRGVLHDREVTYSIVAGVRDGLPRGVSASYTVLCGALVEAYREIGIPAALTSRPRGDKGAGACYLHATHADLSLGAAKLSGSAQVWSRDSCLQHGSFVLSRDIDVEAAIFRLGDRGSGALARGTETIAGALGSLPDASEVRASIVKGLARGLDARFDEDSISAAEAENARHLKERFKVL